MARLHGRTKHTPLGCRSCRIARIILRAQEDGKDIVHPRMTLEQASAHQGACPRWRPATRDERATAEISSYLYEEDNSDPLFAMAGGVVATRKPRIIYRTRR
ncbi:hypothetical protein HGA91_00970 [candidate division WWE3 bacterium]|nr:hypothetical protein [candidate division WWE3 bacterium]